MVFIIGFVLLIRGIYGDELLHIDNSMLGYGGTVFTADGEIWDPHRVIDGNSSTDADKCHCCTAIERPAWISLNIGQPYLLTKIEIFGRTDGAAIDIGQSRNIRLCLRLLDEMDDVCHNITNNYQAIVFDPPQLGQFVKISGPTNKPPETNYMTICEIKIFQQKAINIARNNGLVITQGNTYSTCAATKAVDGMYSASYTDDPNDVKLCKKCSVTDIGNPYWKIEFGTQVFAQYINIIGRINGAANYQSENLLVYTTNFSTTTNQSLETHITSANINLGQLFELRNRRFRYLTIQRFYNSAMTLCEVQIYQKVCENGTFGEQCQPCGHCKTATTCNQTGHCTSGCEPGWHLFLCNTECVDRTYGYDCQNSCGHCKAGSICNKTTGICQSGCEPGWQLNKCDTACVGSYGENCSNLCSLNCRNNETCNNENGLCSKGCKPGYAFSKDPLCNTACTGTYGDNCDNFCSWNCRNNETCNPVNGYCSTGCKPGYNYTQDTRCFTACTGTYGDNCANSCSWNCRYNETCNPVNGYCSTGCKPGYNYIQDKRCFTECSGYFGINCSSRCHCSNDTEKCNTLDGHCNSGCAEGWGGKNCSIDQNILLAGIYNATATQSSTYQLCNASRIIDGVFWTEAPYDCSKCSATNGQDEPWVQIALNRQIVGSSVRVFGRSDPQSQSQYLQVYVRNDTIHTGHTGYEISIGLINDSSTENGELIHLGNRAFRYLVIRKSTVTVMAICEIKLYKAECQDGHFGDMCALECHCVDGQPCDSVTGQCKSPGCFAGWQGEACNSTCEHRLFGHNCSSTCHCNDNADCDKINGSCPGGCDMGWTRLTCSEACPFNRFGQNCNQTCHCDNHLDCNKTDGACPGLCEIGWIGTSCSDICGLHRFGQNCNKTCHCNDTDDCTKTDGICPGMCNAGWTNTHCSEQCAPGYYGTNCSMDCHCEHCHNVNGSCALYSTPCRGGFRLEGEFCTPEDSKPTSAGAIGAGVGAALAVIIGIAVGLWFFRKRGSSKNNQRSGDSTELTDISKVQRHANAHENAVYAKAHENAVYAKAHENAVYAATDANTKIYANTESDYYSFKDVVPGIKIHLLWDYIREKTKPGSSFFEEEFAKLPAGLIHKHDVAAAVENRGKNRYREMFAYDHSRVHLEKEKPNDSEYINASFIHGFGKVKKFIASQGATEKMIDDFWRMIWQQRVDKIAMLTNLIEMGTLKCLQYWPEELNGVCTYGGVEIKYAGIEETFDYNIRSFDIRRGKELRRVKQFHFKTWPDKDVPETTWCLVDFWRAVDTSDAANISPIVVHCSAGVGRTGTFIALDILITQARMEGSIRPLQMVEALRQQRVNMVQTKAQYKYLHEAVADALLMGTHHVLTMQFTNVFDYMMGKEKGSMTTRLEEQLNLIVQSVQEVPESVEASLGPTYGNMETVMSEIDAYRPQLQKRGSKFIQQLGAIFLPTFGNTNALLVCMSPTDQHLEEFWSLVEEQHVTTLINLSESGSTAYTTCQFLGGRGSGRVGRFSVNNIQEKKIKAVLERSFSFRDENHEDEDYLTTVKQFQLTTWLDGHDTPPNMQSFLDLIEEVLNWQPHLSDKRPILIHCQTGFIRCGLTALVLNEIQRIRKENGQINIVESVKTMKTRCRDLVQNKTQYRFCYEAMLTYIKNSGTYANL